MPWMRGTATDFVDFADQVNDYLTLALEAGTPSAGSNTGNGIVYGASANISAVAETWTITLTSATAFTVSGSVSGSQATGTVDVPYSNDYISFTVVAGTTAFVSSDSFTVAIASSTALWSTLRAVTGNTTDTEPEYIWEGIGSGTEEIVIGMRLYTNWSTYHNWNLQGFTGYVSANDFDLQPGYVSDSSRAALSSSIGAFTFYVWKTSRRVHLLCVLGATYVDAYLGYADVLGASSQYPYPLTIGGNTYSLTDTIAGVSTRDPWWSEGNAPTLRILFQSGYALLGDQVWPYCNSSAAGDSYRESIDGARDLFPVTFRKESSLSTLGQAYNCFFIPNSDAAISVSDILKESDLSVYLVTQANGQSGNMNVMAIRLD